MLRLLILLNLLLSSIAPIAMQPAIIPETGQDNLSGVHVDEQARVGSLAEFIPTVQNGNASQIVGLYIKNALALRVVQQPASNPGFVSEEPDAVTQFAMASRFGTIGLLAHNTAAGQHFSKIKDGMKITLVFGDGTVTNFRVRQIRQFQALTPTSPYSNFKDLSAPEQVLSVESLFYQIYQSNGSLVLQTCIEKEGELSWGRLFIIAEPITSQMIYFIRPSHSQFAFTV